jgi:hypothetical protein
VGVNYRFTLFPQPVPPPIARLWRDQGKVQLSYVCPLAPAVLTYAPGETVEIAGKEAVILEIR